MDRLAMKLGHDHPNISDSLIVVVDWLLDQA